MNRMQRALVSSLAPLAVLSALSRDARAQAPAAARAATPRPVMAPAPAVYRPAYRASVQHSHVGDPIPAGPWRTWPYYRDWSTGRDVRLSKPWMQPIIH